MKKALSALLCLIMLFLAFPAIADNTLEVTPFGFKIVYSAYMEKFKQATDVYDFEKSDDTLIVNLSKLCSVLLTLSDNSIKELCHVGMGAETSNDNTHILFSMCATILSVDPSMTIENIVTMIEDLVDKGKYETKYCIYEYASAPSVGMAMTIKPV